MWTVVFIIYHIASESDIIQCIKVNKPQVVYTFMNIMYCNDHNSIAYIVAKSLSFHVKKVIPK